MIMITGVAGFIGYSLARCLLESGYLVVGVDNINDYYDISIKQHRLQILKNYSGFLFRMVDISLSESVDNVLKNIVLKWLLIWQRRQEFVIVFLIPMHI